MLSDIALILGAYLFGSIPYMLLLGHARGFDLSQEDDLHSATYHKVGPLEGLSGIFVDVMKGALPIIVGFAFGFSLPVTVTAGVIGVLGQMWPVFHKFNGERGNSSGAGLIITLTMFLTATTSHLAYWVFIITAIPGLIGFIIRTIPRIKATGQTDKKRDAFGGPVSNSLPLGMIISFAVAPLASWLLSQPLELTIGLLVLFVAIAIRRLTIRLGADLKTKKASTGNILINRLLFDRSYL